MNHLSWAIALGPVFLLISCLVLFPLGLMLFARASVATQPAPAPSTSPTHVSIVITCHNEAAELPGALSALLALQWLEGPPQIIVASDASTDATDSITLAYADAGVALHRHDPRGGKTAVENSLRDRVTGHVIFFMDAASRPDPDCGARMLQAFADPQVGVVSSRDVSPTARPGAPRLTLATAYLSYEMWLRDLETRAGGIVGASGSLYAIRKELFLELAPHATRDFASVLLAHDRAMKAVSAPAHCVVRPAAALAAEEDRLSRTMAQGMATLLYYRRWLHPLARPGFVIKLLCHKVARWLLLPAAVAGSIIGLTIAGSTQTGRIAVAVACLPVLGWLSLETWMMQRGHGARPWLRTAAMVIVAGLLSWKRLLAGQQTTHWEPTRRQARSV